MRIRTKLNNNDDVFASVKEISSREHVSNGEVVSRLLRNALTSTPPSARRAPRTNTLLPSSIFRMSDTRKLKFCYYPHIAHT